MSVGSTVSGKTNPVPPPPSLLEQVVSRSNMSAAYKRVVQNKGSAGIDGMTVAELKPYLDQHWDRLKTELSSGTYQPKGVRGVKIPKPGGGDRQLGIPTVVDRLIQQALTQVLSPLFDAHFSTHSYGFRPGRSAQDAVKAAQVYQLAGKRWVVDMDIEKFFDHVHHDVLISLIRKRMNEAPLLKLIRRYLQSGIMQDGLYEVRRKGTPQGSPLSPLLSNIMLDELDKELESRGHDFARYADDCNIYVHSRKAGERTLSSISKWLQDRLRLTVNESKSAVARPWERSFLGYSFTNTKDARIRVPKKSVDKLKKKVKELLRKGKGRNLTKFVGESLNPLLRGWMNYFKLTSTRLFAKELDKWLRHCLRNIIWRQWKRPRTRRIRLMRLGISEQRASTSAFNGRGPWWNSGASHMNEAFPVKFFNRIGLFNLTQFIRKEAKTC